MNNIYITLGEGKNTAVLQPQDNGGSRKVVTLPHEPADKLARALSTFYTDVANALWDVAVAHDGKPAHARRVLLDVFDHEVRGTAGPALDVCWDLSAGLARKVADTLLGQTEAVVVAVRREVADLLKPYDGVLVGGVMWSQAYRPGYLRLAINDALLDSTLTSVGGTTTYTPFFEGLDDHALALDSVSLVDAIGVETAIYYSDESFLVNEVFVDFDSCHREFAETSYAELRRESGDEYPYLEVVPTHLRAWMSATRPDLLEKFPHVGS